MNRFALFSVDDLDALRAPMDELTEAVAQDIEPHTSLFHEYLTEWVAKRWERDRRVVAYES